MFYQLHVLYFFQFIENNIIFFVFIKIIIDLDAVKLTMDGVCIYTLVYYTLPVIKL